MASEAAKRVAGTYITDEKAPASPVLRWLRQEARQGLLAKSIGEFCAAQPELLDPALVQIEKVSNECIQCRIPCRLYDHEASSPFPAEVRFRLNPVTGAASRIDV
jgi:hypothetical protein